MTTIEVPPLLRTRTSLVWLVLVVATVVSWALGTSHGIGTDDPRFNSAVILVIAFIKVRFIGMYFMDLRDAPLALRGVFELYCAAVCLGVLAFFLIT